MDDSDDGGLATSLRRSWPLAACVQFLRVFQAPLGLKKRPSGDVLERMLVDPAGHPNVTATVLGRLANVQGRKTYEWERALRARIDEKWNESFEQHPMDECEWEHLEPEQRLDIVHALCEWLCQDDPDIIDALERTVSDKDYTADALREEPIGVDAEGSRYYYLGIDGEDCRLYKETPPKNRGERKFIYDNAEFSTVCTTLEELARLKESLASSKQKSDRDLAKRLADDIIPKLEETKAARERAIRKAERIEQMPKKRSGRLQLLQIKREEEERLREIEEAQLREKLEMEKAKKREEQRLKKLHAREERARLRDAKQQPIGRLITGEKILAIQSREERMRQREAKFTEGDFETPYTESLSTAQPFGNGESAQADKFDRPQDTPDEVFQHGKQESPDLPRTLNRPPDSEGPSENHGLHVHPHGNATPSSSEHAVNTLAKPPVLNGPNMEGEFSMGCTPMQEVQDPPSLGNGHCQTTQQG